MSREPRFASTFLSSSPTCPATQYGLCAPEAARANLNVSLPGWPESLPVTAIVPCQARPPRLVRKRIWDERLADIAHFEDYAARQGTKILGFSCTSRARSRRSASRIVSTSLRRTGSFRLPTYRNANSGAATCTRSRKRSGQRHRSTRCGTSYLPTCLIQTTRQTCHLSAEQIDKRRARAAIRHVHEVHAGHHLE
jgi:hypothetical protein